MEQALRKQKIVSAGSRNHSRVQAKRQERHKSSVLGMGGAAAYIPGRHKNTWARLRTILTRPRTFSSTCRGTWRFGPANFYAAGRLFRKGGKQGRASRAYAFPRAKGRLCAGSATVRSMVVRCRSTMLLSQTAGRPVHAVCSGIPWHGDGMGRAGSPLPACMDSLRCPGMPCGPCRGISTPPGEQHVRHRACLRFAWACPG